MSIGQRWHCRWRWVVLGFASSFAVGVLYALWIQGTGEWTTGLEWERDLMLRLYHRYPEPVDTIFLVVPWAGTNLTLLPLMLAGAIWLIVRRKRYDLAMHLLVVQAGAYLLNLGLKVLFDRPRPGLWQPRGQFAWSSFPSGHLIASVAALFTVAYLLDRERGWRWPYALAAILLAISMYSRLYLGVHWPTDVIGGYLVGMTWLAATLIAFRRPRGATDRAPGEVREEREGERTC